MKEAEGTASVLSSTVLLAHPVRGPRGAGGKAPPSQPSHLPPHTPHTSHLTPPTPSLTGVRRPVGLHVHPYRLLPFNPSHGSPCLLWHRLHRFCWSGLVRCVGVDWMGLSWGEGGQQGWAGKGVTNRALGEGGRGKVRWKRGEGRGSERVRGWWEAGVLLPCFERTVLNNSFARDCVGKAALVEQITVYLGLCFANSVGQTWSVALLR